MAARLELRVLRLDDGRDLAFAEYGDPGGSPVFAFHGTPGSHIQASPLDDVAAARSVRLIAPDRPGYGHSSFDPALTLTGWVDDVRAIADQLGLDRFGVVGVSGGGPYAAACAHELGDRLTGCAIVSGCGSLAEPQDAEGMMPLNRLLAWLARRAPAVLPLPFAALALVARRLPEATVREQMISQMPESDAAILRRPEIAELLVSDLATKHPTMAKASAQDYALFAQPWGFRLEAISAVPVHVWQGDQDVNVPVHHAHRYANLIPSATLHLAEGEGHFLVYDRGAEIVDAVTGAGPG